MTPIPTKPFWASKTFWAALLGALLGGYQLLAPAYGWDTRWVEGVWFMLASLGFIGIRTAKTTLGNPETAPAPSTPDNVIPAALTPAQVPTAPAWPDAAQPLEERL